MELVIQAFTVVITVLVLINEATALSCLKCEEENCRDEGSLQCKGGITLDACGCCKVCAKVEGESCGGPWNISGVCSKGLICTPKSDLQPGRCKNPEGNKIPSKLPRCIQKYKRVKSYYCRTNPTVFCEQYCQRCCINPTACNPDWSRYIPKRRCQGQMRLHGPKNIKYGDKIDDDDDDGDVDDVLESLDNKIKA